MSMNWKIAQSICNKVMKNCYNQTETRTPWLLHRIKTDRPNSEFPLRIAWGGSFNTGRTNGGSRHNRLVSLNYTTSCNQTESNNVRFLNFNTEQERYNAWQSYLTKFARFCVMLDESTKLAPYMDDYSEPWTDKRFKEHFGLTDIEWQLIDTVIKD